jgi:hypothetical protein
MDEALLAAFEDVQHRTIDLVAGVARQLRPGMTDTQVVNEATSLLDGLGLEGWFRRPGVRIGASPGRRLRLPGMGQSTVEEGVTVELAMAPRRGLFWGEFGTTLVFGGEPSELVRDAMGCTRATMGYAAPTRCAGELFVYARAFAVNHRLHLQSERDVGWELRPAEGLLAKGFPTLREASLHLRRHRLHFLNPRRLDGLYAVGPCLSRGGLEARFLEMLHVGAGTTRLLGRKSLDEVGLLPGY